MKKINFLICLLFMGIIATAQNSQVSLTLIRGLSLWNNGSINYIEPQYIGMMVRGFKSSDKRYEFGYHAYLDGFSPEIDSIESVRSPYDVFSKTRANNSSLNLGLLIKSKQPVLTNLDLIYRLSSGLDFTFRNPFQFLYFPDTPSTAGYNSMLISIKSNGLFSSIGYFIMPWIDLIYYINIDNLRMGFDLGMHLYHRFATMHSSYETQADNQINPNIEIIKEQAVLFSGAFQFGILIAL